MPLGASTTALLGPTVALLGAFQGGFDELLAGRIVERELRRRLPLVRVDRYAPLARPTPLDGGRPLLDLGPPEPSRRHELEARYDLLVVLQRLVGARDGDRSFWREAGVAFDLVADAAVLAPRLFDAELLRGRLAYLRVMGWYPQDHAPVVVEAPPGGSAGAALSAAATVDGPVVVVELTALAVPSTLDERPARLPAGRVWALPPPIGLEDAVAALAHAHAFVGESPGARGAARSFGVPARNPFAATGDAHATTAEIDAEFDRLASHAEEAYTRRAARDGRTGADLARALAHAEERYAALEQAYEARGARLVRERLQFAEIVEGLERGAGGDSAEEVAARAALESRLELALADEAAARHELDRLRGGGRAAPDA